MKTVQELLMEKGPDVIVTGPETTVREASKLMAEANVGSVIVRSGASILGIFTERDLLRRVVARGKDPESLTMQDVMSSPVKTCRLQDSLQKCAQDLTDSHIRHLAVVEGGALIGLVGLRDILTSKAIETVLA